MHLEYLNIITLIFCSFLVYRPSIKTGEPIDFKEAMSQFALDAIGKCAFGLRLRILTTESNSPSLYRKVVKTLKDPGLIDTFRIILPQFVNPTLLKCLGVKITTDEVENFIFDLLREAEELRRKDQRHRDDLLQLMLDIKDEENDKANREYLDDQKLILEMKRFRFAKIWVQANVCDTR